MDFTPLSDLLGERFLVNEPMSRHTSFKIGGAAEAFCRVENEAELVACIQFARENGLPVFFLAGGTNLLVRDGGIRGVCVKLEGDFKAIRIDGRHVKAGAGMNLALVARKAAKAGLSGLEFGIGIPGSLGGAVIMNAGAHGQDISGVCRSLGLLRDGKPLTVDAEEAGFAYRHSAFKLSSDLVLWAHLELTPADPNEIEARMNDVLSRRKASQPLDLPNAGCVFKNPEGDSAGRLIELCGLKGLSKGGAEISPLHANFVVNKGGATASDVIWLMTEARRLVREKTGIDLKHEVLVVGVDA